MERRQWYVIYSKPHREEVAEYHLRRRGVEVFFPRLQLPLSIHKRKQIIPLFPSYLFARIQIPEEYHSALWSPGVKDLVSFNGVPAPLDEEIVAFLRQQATAGGVLMGCSKLEAGEEVRISRGPFEGLAGIIQNPPDARGRIRVLLELLNRQVKVELSIQYVESKWAVKGEKGADLTA